MIRTCSFCTVVDIYWTCKERAVTGSPAAIEREDREDRRSVSIRNSAAWALDPAEEGLSVLVLAPANLQIFPIMDNVTTNSWTGRRSGSSDLTTKPLCDGYHSPRSLAHCSWKLTHPDALGTFTLWGFGHTLPYLGSVVFLHSGVPSRFCHYCWRSRPEQRWRRGPKSSPPLWNCEGSECVTGAWNFQKQCYWGHFSNFNVPRNHLKILLSALPQNAYFLALSSGTLIL